MATYRQERNIEASLIDQITELLENGGWIGFTIVKSLSQAYEKFPAICINVVEPSFTRKEIGNYEFLKIYTVNIRLFCDNDGQRLDLADYLLDELEKGFKYYEYVIEGGDVSQKLETGRININRMRESRKELRNTENLVKEDKCRHLISFDVKIS